MAGLASYLSQRGFSCAISSIQEFFEYREQPPDVVLLFFESLSALHQVAQQIKQEKPVPILAVVGTEILSHLDEHIAIDDFITTPDNGDELSVRLNRLIRKTKTDSDEVIQCGDLVIDITTCEVFLTDKRLALTFKEFELLKLLASNRGRVYTREALLNKIWGYEYFGGDRTVDVHIRRLRSKVEDADHTFIETVRNIGYRFVPDK
jgi:two-component system, OmpR family, alkaline phosphatase synthesis response regulator PhoP